MILLILFSVVLEVMKMQSVQNLLEPILEPLIRRVVSLLSQIILFYFCDNGFYSLKLKNFFVLSMLIHWNIILYFRGTILRSYELDKHIIDLRLIEVMSTDPSKHWKHQTLPWLCKLQLTCMSSHSMIALTIAWHQVSFLCWRL